MLRNSLHQKIVSLDFPDSPSVPSPPHQCPFLPHSHLHSAAWAGIWPHVDEPLHQTTVTRSDQESLLCGFRLNVGRRGHRLPMSKEGEH